MTDNTVIEEQPHDVAAPDTPAPEQSIDDLLAEFDRATATPEPANTENPPDGGISTDQSVDQQIADLLGPAPKIAELQSQVDAFKASEFQAQERQAAERWAAELQEVVASSNPNVENDFVIRELKVLSADNPGVLEAAWQYRNLSDADLAIAKRDFAAAERLYAQAVAAPDTDPRKKEALRFLEQRGAQLQAMLSARSVIRSAHNQIRKRADSVKAPYDPDVSATREEIAHLMKEGGSGRERPPVQLGNLSDQEYRAYLKQIGINGF